MDKKSHSSLLIVTCNSNGLNEISLPRLDPMHIPKCVALWRKSDTDRDQTPKWNPRWVITKVKCVGFWIACMDGQCLINKGNLQNVLICNGTPYHCGPPSASRQVTVDAVLSAPLRHFLTQWPFTTCRSSEQNNCSHCDQTGADDW